MVRRVESAGAAPSEFSRREQQYIQSHARAAIAFAKNSRQRIGPRPEDNVRLAMKQYPKEYWEKTEGERKRLAAAIRREIKRVQAEDVERERQALIAAQKAEAMEEQLKVVRQEEEKLMEEIKEKRRREAMNVLRDEMLEEQDDLEDWRANGRP